LSISAGRSQVFRIGEKVLRNTVKRGIQGVILLAALLAVCSIARSEQVNQLRAKGFVSDFAGVIDPATQQKLTGLCREVNQKAKAQIAVVTVRTTSGVPIEEFSINLAERWGVGPKTNDRGVMILLVVNDHRYRIEVGYGLEGVLPDGKVGRIGRETVPLLRDRNYSGAMLLMTRRVADAIAAGRGITLTSLPPIPEADESGESVLWYAGAWLAAAVAAFRRADESPRARLRSPPSVDSWWLLARHVDRRRFRRRWFRLGRRRRLRRFWRRLVRRRRSQRQLVEFDGRARYSGTVLRNAGNCQVPRAVQVPHSPGVPCPKGGWRMTNRRKLSLE
jgi:uncharacterized membrane protein YgcG